MSTFVFLGPSLDITTAKSIFPAADYLPPVACGDIIQVMKLGAKRIVIIDGYFENQPSVWHKEILYALDRGVAVYGASSMGALRAAELNSFGMIGIGQIYRKYKNGEIADDDEVALLHLPEEDNFKPYSLPMINIRFTLDYAIKLKIITLAFATDFLNMAKEIFYKERTEEALRAKTIHLTNIQPFFVWFKNNYINQKEIDAKELLFALENNLLPQSHVLPANSNFSVTALFRNLKLDNLIIPFRTFKDYLPSKIKFNILAKLFDEYPISKQVAKTIGVMHEVGFILIKEQELLFNYQFLDPVIPLQAGIHNYKEITYFSRELIINKQNYESFIKLLVSGELNDIEKKSMEILAKIVVHLYHYMINNFDKIDENTIFRTAQQFFLKKNIDNQERFVSWLQQNDMEINEFKMAMLLLHVYDYFILQNNLSTLMQARNSNLYDYFSLAISLNGLDKKIIQSFTSAKCELLRKCEEHLAADNDLYAIKHDYADAFTMRSFLDKISNSDISWINDVSLVLWKLQ